MISLRLSHSSTLRTLRHVIPCITTASSSKTSPSLIITTPNGTQTKTTSFPSQVEGGCNLKLYTSRAHPQPIPQYSIIDAVRITLEETEKRTKKRADRWDLYREKRVLGLKKKGLDVKEEEGPYRNQDETISLALNLNLDPRKPKQALRGQMPLPHGTGKAVQIAVFTLSDIVATQALKEGAVLAGGQELMDGIVEGKHLDEFNRVIATPDIIPMLGKTCARILGPRGLMPNPKMGNIVNELDVTSSIKEQLAGMVPYRTDKSGIVHAPIGKYSFGQKKLEENIKSFMEGIVDVEPELDAKAKKQRVGGKGGKFILKMHINATQGKAVCVDLRTADPNSTFFMKAATA